MKTKKTPKLRFPGFSGEWEEKKLGSISKTFSGGTPKSTNKKFYSGKIPFIKSGEISKTKTEQFLSEEGLNNSSAKLVDKGDILYALYGATSGQVSVSQITGAINQAVLCIKPSANRYFIYSKLVAEKDNILNTYLQGGQGNLSADILKKLPIALPSTDEQEKIAGFLGVVDDKIAGLQRKKELLEKYKKGIMQKIFPPAGGQEPEIRFPGFTKPWQEKKLGDVVEIIGGGTPDTTKSSYWGGSISWLTPTEVKSKYIDSSVRTITEEGFKNSSVKLLPVGTIIFTSRATVGDVAIARIPVVTNQGFQSMIVKSEHDNIFVYYWAATSKKEFTKKSSGSTFSEISGKEMRKLKLKIPTKEEQQKIAEFLTGIDEKIEAQERKLDQAKQFKKALLQQMFV